MSATQEEHQPLHSPNHNAQRPRGILKNSNSYQLSSPNAQQPHSPTDAPLAVGSPGKDPISLSDDAAPRRPSMPHQVSEKELVHQNTIANAGPRRNSSNNRSQSRRQSRATNDMDVDDNSPRLRWDEANLYLNEQERPATMKIDEPKTPFVKQSDLPDDADEEEAAAIDPSEVMVDELDKAKSQPGLHRGRRSVKVGAAGGETDIPDLDLGEAEDATAVPMTRTESAEKRVIVDPNAIAEDGDRVPPEEETRSASEEARKKHREFEERRKKHYEIPPGALSHPEEADDDDEDNADPPTVPPLPRQ